VGKAWMEEYLSNGNFIGAKIYLWHLNENIITFNNKQKLWLMYLDYWLLMITHNSLIYDVNNKSAYIINCYIFYFAWFNYCTLQVNIVKQLEKNSSCFRRVAYWSHRTYGSYRKSETPIKCSRIWFLHWLNLLLIMTLH
jgi:hypothetical protein